MTIQVRVLSAQALARLKQVDMASKAAANGVGAVGANAQKGIPALSKWGNQIQWAGRQLIYNFTLPIALATAAATKWALENEKGMTRVVKVYGDGSKRFRQLSKTEIPALAQAFEALSNQFGIQQSEVINIGADWAAAGASGIALAKSVKLTLETMVLGELEAADATKQLIAIQAQYGFTVGQLSKTIDILNMVENQTGASMGDLMQGMSRAAGVAREAGIDVEHLSAMMAALVPSAGSAANAGNALKTIISRLLSPTGEAVDLLNEMGIQTNSFAWNSMNASERIESLSKHFLSLSDAQKTHMATVLGSRWQLNRLIVLMRAVQNENSYYNKSLKATSDTQKVFAQRQFELNKVLNSSPQMMKQAWVILQNALTRVIIPIIPFIVYLAQQLAKLAHAFADLPGPVQKLILVGLLFLALLGPIARYVGAVANLLGLMQEAARFAGRGFIFFGKSLVSPIKYLYLLSKGLILKVATAFVYLGLTMLRVSGVASIMRAGLLTGFLALGSALITSIGSLMTAISAVFFGANFWGALFARIKVGMLALRAQFVLGMSWIIFSISGGAAKLILVWQQIWAGLAATVTLAIPRIQAAVMAMGPAITGILAGFRSAWTILWIHLNTVFVEIASAMAFAVNSIWLGLRTTGVAAMAGLRAIGAAMVTGAIATSRAAAAAFVALPRLVGTAMLATGALIMTLWKGIMLGLMRLAPMLLKALTGPWGLAFMAILGLSYRFQDQIVNAWHGIQRFFSNFGANIAKSFSGVGKFFSRIGDSIVNAFWKLPAGIRDAMITVLTIVRDAALKVYEWMSYLNPFARHSPSLVDSVTKGMDTIEGQYSRAKNAGAAFKKAGADLKKFKDIANKKDAKQAAAANLKDQASAVKHQEAVVNAWKNKLDAANASLDKQQKILDRLQDHLSGLQEKYDAASQSMQDYASAPIKGMGAMQDKIDENAFAQKKLQLQMAQWEKANGSIDGMRNRLDGLKGDLELLRGNAESLRMKGAGSDVLGPLNAQIAAMETQANATKNAVDNAPINKMADQLAELQKNGEMLQLQYDVKFDPLTNSIDKLANAQKELSYDQIVNGINKQKGAMAALKPQIDAATLAVSAQEAAVKRNEAVRDRVQASYDRENDKLQNMQDAYQKTKDKVDKLSSSLDKLSKKGSKSSPFVPTAVETFRAGKGANWADVGGSAKIGREGGLGDQSDLIKKFTEDSENQMGKIFGSFDMMAPIKKMWNQAWGWIQKNVAPVVMPIVHAIKKTFSNIGNPFESKTADKIVVKFREIWDKVVKIGRRVRRVLNDLWDLFGPDIKRSWNAIKKAAVDLWRKVGPEVLKLGDTFKDLWKIAKVVFGAIVIVFKIFTSIFSRILGPILDLVVDFIKNVIRVFRGVIQVIAGILTLDFGKVLSGLGNIFAGLFSMIGSIFVNGAKILWGIFWGFVMGIVDIARWLWDKLVGHSIIPDIVHGIIHIFKLLIKLPVWLWKHVLKPVYNFFAKLWKKYVKPALSAWWSGIKAEWRILQKVATWLWDHVLKPVWNWVKRLWSKYVKPALKAWWAGIKAEWAIIKKLADWVWDHILKPVFNWFKRLWTDKVRPELHQWWDRIKGAWDKLKDLGGWIKDKVMDPVFNAFRRGWNAVKDWFKSNKDTILSPVNSLVNGVIGAVNAMIRGLNKISDVLPGVKWDIDIIPKLAAGGNLMQRRVGSGFKTNGARAIVGEGKRNYPEFVIPTDPTHNRRARSLLRMAATKIGAVDEHGIPMYGIGGWLGDRWNDIKNIGNKLKDVPRQAASKIMNPLLDAGSSIIRKIGWQPAESPPLFAIGKLRDWVNQTNKMISSGITKYGAPAGGDVSVPDPAHPRGHMIWRGGEFTNRFVAHMQKAEKIANQTISVLQGGFRPYTPYSGASHEGDAVDLQVNNSLIRALRRVGIAAGDRTGLGDWMPHVHAIPGPDAGYGAGSAPWQWSDYIARGGMNQALNSPWGLANGAVVKAKMNGVMARLAEGGRDEVVLPLPRGLSAESLANGGNSTTHIHIGKIELPNIKSGDDAEKLVENLALLAKD